MAFTLAAITLHSPQVVGAREADRSPRLVWNGGDRFYVASPDSGALAAGMVVHVLDRHREVARGEVTRVIDGTMASVRLTGGLLAGKARLDRLEVRLDPATPHPVRALRLGLPARSRAGLAFACPEAGLDLAALPRAYRAETLAVDGFRLIAADSGGTAAAWPETLLVRQFGDRADEEIALLRAELDLAVFWPGEPSPRMREGTSGYETLLGNRARGALVALDPPGDSAIAQRLASDMAALNAEMFGGDLRPWMGSKGVTDGPSRGARGIRYAVDAAVPGRQVIERFLALRNPASARPDDVAIRLDYFDVVVEPFDWIESPWNGGSVVPLLTLRCPEICSADAARTVRTLGADPFANLLRCGAGGRRP